MVESRGGDEQLVAFKYLLVLTESEDARNLTRTFIGIGYGYMRYHFQSVYSSLRVGCKDSWCSGYIRLLTVK